jgi:hypothetical protein
MDEQVYMTLRIIKQNMNERVEDYYKQIFNYANFFQHLIDNCWIFRVGLLTWSYYWHGEGNFDPTFGGGRLMWGKLYKCWW